MNKNECPLQSKNNVQKECPTMSKSNVLRCPKKKMLHFTANDSKASML